MSTDVYDCLLRMNVDRLWCMNSDHTASAHDVIFPRHDDILGPYLELDRYVQT